MQSRVLVILFLFLTSWLALHSKTLVGTLADAYNLQAFVERAAQLGHVSSQIKRWNQSPSIEHPYFETAFENHIPQALYLKASAELAFGNETQALPLFKLASDDIAQASEAYLEGLIKLGHWHSVYDFLSEGGYSTNANVEFLVRSIRVDNLQPKTQISRPACLMKLQPITTSPLGLKHAQSMLTQFDSDERLKALPLCVLQPLLVPPPECDNIATAANRHCVLSSLPQFVSPRQFSHLLMIVDNPTSFVQNGVVWLSDNSPYTVFVHELAHLVAFVDEYPLKENQAQEHCHDLSFSANLSVTASPDAQWRARTCQHLDRVVYKRSNELTFMEYHDLGTIPPLYQALWAQRLLDTQVQIPAQVAISKALNWKGRVEEAKKWEDQAAAYWQLGISTGK